jgi:hypothetical protein
MFIQFKNDINVRDGKDVDNDKSAQQVARGFFSLAHLYLFELCKLEPRLGYLTYAHRGASSSIIFKFIYNFQYLIHINYLFNNRYGL